MQKFNTEEIMDAIQLIEFSIQELPICQLEDVNELLKPILSRILSGVMNLSRDMTEPKNTIPALGLAVTILEEFKDEVIPKQENEYTELAQSIDQFSEFFSKLCSHIINDDLEIAVDMPDEIDHVSSAQQVGNEDYIETFKLASEIIQSI
jgi:uncharacterized protein YozE (UPF0346 family)